MRSAATIRIVARAALLAQGHSLSSWARSHGYAPGVVTKIFSRFAGSPKRPKRGRSLAIIEALERETAMTLCGGGE